MNEERERLIKLSNDVLDLWRVNETKHGRSTLLFAARIIRRLAEEQR